MDDKNAGGDVLGVRPLADAALVVTKGSVEGAGAFLSRICLPAAEEFGLLLKDKVSNWRALNMAKISAKAQRNLSAREDETKLHAHPRIVGKIIDQGSWEDNDQVQSMWAGLLASACTQEGDSQQNLIFLNLLEQMTSSQALLLNYACDKAQKYKSKSGYIHANNFELPNEEILGVLGTNDIHQADVELDHLRELGLLSSTSGFDPLSPVGEITPAPLGLHFYVRCQGFVGSPIDYFGLDIEPSDDVENSDKPT